MPVYVPPYDERERHLPGYNFAGPGTDVERRLAEGVEPMNELDAACLVHDLVTESRSPIKPAVADPVKIREADAELKRDGEVVTLLERKDIEGRTVSALKASGNQSSCTSRTNSISVMWRNSARTSCTVAFRFAPSASLVARRFIPAFTRMYRSSIRSRSSTTCAYRVMHSLA